jgi:hypothetical protein
LSPLRVVLWSTSSSSLFGGRAVVEGNHALVDAHEDEYGEAIEHLEGSRLSELRTDG